MNLPQKSLFPESSPKPASVGTAIAKGKSSPKLSPAASSSRFDKITGRIGKIRTKLDEEAKKNQKSMDQRQKDLEKQIKANKSPADKMRENFQSFMGSSALNNTAAIPSPAPLNIPSTAPQSNQKVAFAKYIRKFI